MTRSDKQVIELPMLPFMYTLDQVAVIMSTTLAELDQYLIKMRVQQRLSQGRAKMLRVNNIALESEKPDWRVSETELRRWIKALGFRTRRVVYEEY